ncbi:MAG: HEAT repeat domain-containing protein [Candidatus Hydrogenedentota bacterium]
MDWLNFLASPKSAVAGACLLAGAALLIAGAGYRRFAMALVILAALSAAAGVAVFAVSLGVLLTTAGSGEGAGLGAGIGAIILGLGAGGLTFAGGLLWLALRGARYRERGTRVLPLYAAGALLIVFATGITLLRFPQWQSAGMLVNTLGSPNGPAGYAAREELIARGPSAVPEIIAQLHAANENDIQEFESGRTLGIMEQLGALGAIGGPEAIAELRAWLNRDCAPDIRGSAASALAEAGDTESAHAIAVLIENDDYEWRKTHLDLVYALGLLKAKDEVPYIASALTTREGEQGSSWEFQMTETGVAALAKIDTPEAWAAISELAASSGDYRFNAIKRTLDAMGKTLPGA